MKPAGFQVSHLSHKVKGCLAVINHSATLKEPCRETSHAAVSFMRNTRSFAKTGLGQTMVLSRQAHDKPICYKTVKNERGFCVHHG